LVIELKNKPEENSLFASIHIQSNVSTLLYVHCSQVID